MRTGVAEQAPKLADDRAGAQQGSYGGLVACRARRPAECPPRRSTSSGPKSPWKIRNVAALQLAAHQVCPKPNFGENLEKRRNVSNL